MAVRRPIVAVLCALLAVASAGHRAPAQESVPAGATVLAGGRFRVLHFPSESRLARSLLDVAVANDSFPGLPRLLDTVIIRLAPDEKTFRAWGGSSAPEWGGAFAFPSERLIVMQGSNAGGSAGDPRVTLRHELAHLALGEAIGPSVPRWFDEGYASFAAGEWGRDEILATSFGLVWRGIPTLDGLDSLFYAGPDRAQRAYALSHRAVAELAAMGGDRGLSLLFEQWRTEHRFETALRGAYGMTSGDFEQRFKSRVRQQYGALALAADLSVLAAVLTFLLGPLWWQRRQRQRHRIQQMREADARQEAREKESALAALLGEGGGTGRDGADRPPSGAPD